MTQAIDLKPRYRVVVALDLSEYSEIVLEHALDEAARHAPPDLHFVTVLDDPRADLDDAKMRLGALVLPAFEDFDCGDWRARLHVRVGKPHEEITDLAAEIRAQLVVVGNFGVHGRKWAASVANKMLETATCPTLVVGLSDQSPDKVRQCPDCVAARAESDGVQWFCAAHAAPDRVSHATVFVTSASPGGGLMW